MGNIIGLDLNVDQDFIYEAVKQSVLVGISEALNGKNEIVSQIVKMTLSTKVDDKGKINSYDSYNKYRKWSMNTEKKSHMLSERNYQKR